MIVKFYYFIIIPVVLCISANAFNLTILHTNDVQSRIEEIDAYGGTCSLEESQNGQCFGGVARRHSVVQQVRNSGKNVLFVDVGNQFQGTIWFLYYQEQAIAFFNNFLGYDVAGLGNHEFDEGTRVLARYIKNLTYPIINCNVDAKDDPFVHGLYSSSVVLNIGGEDIGIVSYMTTRLKYFVTAEYIENLKVNDEVECLKREVDQLKARGINKIIALGSVRRHENIKLAQEVSGIDVIVGGDSNLFFYTGEAPSTEEVYDEYPYAVFKDNGEKVYIVSAYSYGKYLGYLDLTFDENGVITYAHGNPILLDNSVPKDPTIERLVQDWARPLVQFRNLSVGQSYVKLQYHPCRIGECNFGNLVTDSILRSLLLNQPEAGEPWSKVPVAIYNGGGFRGTLHQGEIPLGELMEALPYEDEISSFTLQGRYVKEMLEHSVTSMPGVDPGITHPFGGYLQMSGIKVTYDLSHAPGYRVKSVLIRCSECTVPVYEPLEMDKRYTLATSGFILGGGDNYIVLKDFAENRVGFGFSVAEATRQYIAGQSPVIHGVEGRINNASFNYGSPLPSAANRTKINAAIGLIILLSILERVISF